MTPFPERLFAGVNNVFLDEACDAEAVVMVFVCIVPMSVVALLALPRSVPMKSTRNEGGVR